MDEKMRTVYGRNQINTTANVGAFVVVVKETLLLIQ